MRRVLAAVRRPTTVGALDSQVRGVGGRIPLGELVEGNEEGVVRGGQGVVVKAEEVGGAGGGVERARRGNIVGRHMLPISGGRGVLQIQAQMLVGKEALEEWAIASLDKTHIGHK